MTKTEARAIARARIADVGAGSWAAAGREVVERVMALPEIAAAGVVLIYADTENEIPTAGIARIIRSAGAIVTFPRCLPEGRELSIHRVDADDQLALGGAYGLREPVEACPLVDLGDVDVAIVPGLAWDRTGARLGRGAGYYDRLFARPEWRGFAGGVFLDLQELERVPTDPWDRRLDAIVTPTRVVRPDRPR